MKPEGERRLIKSYDVVVIGSGVFGAWTAYHLRASGRSVALLDAYGAGNSRSSSGDETRVLRMGYGADEIYTRWALHSRQLWIELFDGAGTRDLFQETGALWTPPPEEQRTEETLAAYEKCGVAVEKLSPVERIARFPQIQLPPDRLGIFEPEGGALLARKAVQQVVREAVRNGVQYFVEWASVPENSRVTTNSGDTFSAGVFVYACGPWLPTIFPNLLSGRIRPTRQEVFYFGTPPGDRTFMPPHMPVWLDFSDDRYPYALPNIDGRGFKLAFDRHGPPFDPDTGNRVATGFESARAFLSERFPALANAPLLESRVCQYESTSSGDFLIDRHPGFDNVWLAGGGSGHGFKHGPAVGEYMSKIIDGGVSPEPRFSLATKEAEEKRAVY